MKKIFFLPIALLLVISCKNDSTTKPTTTLPTVIIEPDKVQKNCYSCDLDGSKIDLTIEQKGTKANGTLSYALAEKDGNIGTFEGTIENAVLIAEYTFQSEGMESTRQVAFQFNGSQWIEGYGDMNEDGTQFTDVSKIQFKSTFPLSSVNCE